MNSVEYLILMCEKSLVDNTFTFTENDINNAKKNLADIKRSEDTNRWLDCEQELYRLKNKIKYIFNKPFTYFLLDSSNNLVNLDQIDTLLLNYNEIPS